MLFKKVAVVAAVAVFLFAGLAHAELTNIDIVDGVAMGSLGDRTRVDFAHTYDGNTSTWTYTTSSTTDTDPIHSRLDFAGGATSLYLERIRISSLGIGDNWGGRMTSIKVRYTTDTNADLNARTYTDVTTMAVVNDFPGDLATLPNLIVTGNDIEHLDTAYDGFYSVTFDQVTGATGIEFEWVASDNPWGYDHWQVREIEAYGETTAAVPEPGTICGGPQCLDSQRG